MTSNDTQPGFLDNLAGHAGATASLKLTFEVDYSAGPIRDLVMAVGSGGRLKSLQVSAGHLRSSHEQSSALDFKQGRFDRTGTTKSPQEVC
jgi:hypothetical protein